MAEKLPAKQLTKAQARKATDRVKVAIIDAWRLLTEAHDIGAWSVLGYESFGAYAEAEFDMSPGNAYRLVTQGHVVAAVEEATHSELPPGSVSTREAAELKRQLDEVLAALHAVTEGLAGAERVAAVQAELSRLREERARAKADAKRRKEEEEAERRRQEEENSRARESEDDLDDDQAAEQQAETDPPPEPPEPPDPTPDPAPAEDAASLTVDELLALLLMAPADELGGSLKKITALKGRVDSLYETAGGKPRVSAELAWQALKLFDTARFVSYGPDELKALQRRIAEALKYTPRQPVRSSPGTKQSPARSGVEVTSYLKEGKKK